MSDHNSGSHLFSFLLGGLIGVAIGLLYAPRPGEETREKLKETIDDIKDRYENLKNKVEEGKENIEDVVEKAKKTYRRTRSGKKAPETESEQQI
ncbi:MAG: YtxH domain-containing protein [bacterium]